MKSIGTWRDVRLLQGLCFLLCLHCGLANVCLEGGIPQSELKDLVNADGQSYPIGFWINDWSAGHLTVEVARVLIQETRWAGAKE